MAKFRKRPIIIEAEQFRMVGTGGITEEMMYPDGDVNPCPECNRPFRLHARIPTLEGGHIVCPGDWIITGIEHEKYPCKPTVFEKTYEPIVKEKLDGSKLPPDAGQRRM